MEFNHADLFEALADGMGDRRALVSPDAFGRTRELTFAQLDAEADALAHALLDAGLGPGDHVGLQMFNCVEHIAAVLAALKIRAVPVNVNYRYVEDELVYLYTDAELKALLYDGELADRVAPAVARFSPPHGPAGGDAGEGRPTGERLAGGRLIEVGVESGAVPGAVRYERAVAGRAGSGRADPGGAESGRAGSGRAGARVPGPRSGGDLFIIYTGGTTGFPKGVMWRVEDLLRAFWHNYTPFPATPEELVETAKSGGPLVMMPVAPLIHGAAQVATFIGWWLGATICYVRRFDAADVLRTIARHRVNTINITGDAMARPLAEELASGAHDVSSLLVISSTSALLSGPVRDRLAELLPNVGILDNFGSTESGYTASGVSGGEAGEGLRYRANDPGLTVLDERLRPVEPGSGVIGQVARSGPIALGYWKDPGKTGRTFVTDAEGVRWLLTGDMATVEKDGTIAVLGRGSQCINTGGEKVYAEEVEAVLKGHPDVFDAVVTGIPDERFGSRVAAVVEPREGTRPTAAQLDAHCRRSLSGYKVPRTYAFVPRMTRSPAGKADYRWAKETAQAAATS
ncbi:AMP-binding protein [Nonomuraea sp. NPDC050691]|uniref:AMP-binding protein n=1 Tax=Nonomuraea sp. NPDC050691 TaxID=3155661 RepID=UPI0033E13335